MGKPITLTPRLLDYIEDVGFVEHPVLAKCRKETAELGDDAKMQIGPAQGAFMKLLAGALGARRALEVGTFTGYSTLALTLGMGKFGRMVTCDVSEEYIKRARKYWKEAGVDHQIDVRVAPAVDSLVSMLNAGFAGTFDLAFIDADKPNYIHYYRKSLELLREGGVMLVDNALWSGNVADPKAFDADTIAIRELNAFIADDSRVEHCLTTIGDGLTLCRKL